LIALLNKFKYKGDKFDNVNLALPNPKSILSKEHGFSAQIFVTLLLLLWWWIEHIIRLWLCSSL